MAVETRRKRKASQGQPPRTNSRQQRTEGPLSRSQSTPTVSSTLDPEDLVVRDGFTFNVRSSIPPDANFQPK
jgi:hypothetical protein